MSSARSRDPSPSTWRHPLPHLDDEPLTKWLVRGFMALARRRWLVGVEGLEHIAGEHDPFILVANHSQRPEAVLLSAVVFFERGGRKVHFLADWPMMLVPGVALLYRRNGVVPVFGKSAKPAFLNSLKRFFRKEEGTSWQRARRRLDEGRSIAVFPEGTMNRQPHRLLRGRPGAALLALQAGVPVVPAGILFPYHEGDGPISDGERFAIRFGAPMEPPAVGEDEAKAEARSFHGRIMREIARLSGKTWSPDAARRPRR